MPNYTFHLNIDVYDEEALYEAAKAHAIERDGCPAEEVDQYLKPDGEISVSSCLVMLLDPGVSPAGCSIDNSCAEEG